MLTSIAVGFMSDNSRFPIKWRVSGVKAALFGLIAGLVACYRGLTISGGGAKAVGNAVNETVVYAFMSLFVVNVVVTAIGIRMTAK